jgi:diguanylate cyclase (GGDEF)-like protein/PAS domain S-box-containing protein
LKNRLDEPAGAGGSALGGDGLRLFKTLVVHLTEAVMITDAGHGPDGPLILWVNEALERMTGYEAHELVGKTPRVLQGPLTDREITARIGRALQACRPVEAELVNYRKDGTPFWTDIRISPVFGDEGDCCTHFVALKRDATVRKVREELDRLRTLSLELIAGAAPLADVLEQIAAMVESQSSDAAITVERVDGGHFVRLAAGGRGASEIDGWGAELSDWTLAELLAGRPIVRAALAAAEPPFSIFYEACDAPSALYPIRARSGSALLGAVCARCRDRADPGDLVLQAMSEAAQLAEIAFQRDSDRLHLEHLALNDPLTDLPNRLQLAACLARDMASAAGQQTKIALALLDLDRFKRINDRFGHDAGDSVLKQSAERLRRGLRAGDTLARVGGDEFVLLLPGVTSSADAERAVLRIVAALEPPFTIDGREVIVRASFGIALYPDDSSDTRELFRRADLAMYALRETHAKQPVAAHD